MQLGRRALFGIAAALFFGRSFFCCIFINRCKCKSPSEKIGFKTRRLQQVALA
jgi:hypothetical protein